MTAIDKTILYSVLKKFVLEHRCQDDTANKIAKNYKFYRDAHNKYLGALDVLKETCSQTVVNYEKNCEWYIEQFDDIVLIEEKYFTKKIPGKAFQEFLDLVNKATKSENILL